MTTQVSPLSGSERTPTQLELKLMQLKTWLKLVTSRPRPEPSYPTLPAVDERQQSSVPGVYLVGEVAGVPLIKLGLNAGVDIIDQLAPEIRAESDKNPREDVLDVLIVGAGASGLGSAARAKELGLRAVTVDANHTAETVFTMTKGKLLLAEPESVPLKSSMWFEECTKEELLEKWSAQIAQKELDIREFEKVEDIRRKGEIIEVVTQKGTYLARKVVLAVGKAGNPRKAGVEGEVEHAARIAHRLLDPDDYQDQDILIYGGGDVALEAALQLCGHNRVTLVTIDKAFIYPKKRNVDALLAKQAEGKVTVHMNSHLKAITADEVVFSTEGKDGPTQAIKNNFVFEMIGAELPTPFFKKVGIKLENTWNVKRYAYLAAVFIFVYSLYA
ncbi:MAG: NAD(P)-binding domain-containing protein, partial [Myxococcota bacterium]